MGRDTAVAGRKSAGGNGGSLGWLEAAVDSGDGLGEGVGRSGDGMLVTGGTEEPLAWARSASNHATPPLASSHTIAAQR